MTAYYNEIEPGAAATLRELIKAKVIADGEVDERDIRDVRPSELTGFSQCHFFAGFGVWSYALRLAGWPDDRHVWTGSCPCQPFSAAGKGDGFADERHLWPSWFHLIEERRPAIVFGEQVASPDGLVWLELVQADMEGTGYAFGPVDLCAASVGAPHIRQRLYFVADADSDGRHQTGERIPSARSDGFVGNGSTRWLANSNGWNAGAKREQRSGEQRQLAPHGVACELDLGFWRNAEWIYCRDGKYRPVEPGSFPLAHEAPARVGRLRGYGNAIVAQQAQAFIEAFMSI